MVVNISSMQTVSSRYLSGSARVQAGGSLALHSRALLSELDIAVFVLAGVAARAVKGTALRTPAHTAHCGAAQV